MNKLAEAMRVKEMTVPQLAKLAGCKPNEIWRLVNWPQGKNTRPMNKGWAERLAPYLEVTASWLLFEGEQPFVSDYLPRHGALTEALKSEFEQLLLLPPDRLADVYALVSAISRIAGSGLTAAPAEDQIPLSLAGGQPKHPEILAERSASSQGLHLPDIQPLPPPPALAAAPKGRKKSDLSKKT